MGKEEETASAMSINQTTAAIIAVVMLAIGFGAGYYLFSGGTEEVSKGTTTETVTESFVYDQAKINDITNTFADYFYVYGGGEEVDFTYSTFNEYPGYVDIVYLVNGQPFSVYISKDYTTLYPSILDYESFKSEVEAAVAEFEAYSEQEPEPVELEKTERPSVLLFVMSFCPYGNVAEDAMYPVIGLLGDSIDFEPVYIVSQMGDGSWASLHGQVELNQDIREKIIYNLYGLDTWNEYVKKVNEQCNYQNADECWTGPAGELGINVTEVEEHFNNATEVEEILLRDAAIGASYGVSGSPTLIINGKTMYSDRTPEAYKDTICGAYITPPDDCNVTLSEAGVEATGSCG